jgi:hypothetical protein
MAGYLRVRQGFVRAPKGMRTWAAILALGAVAAGCSSISSTTSSVSDRFTSLFGSSAAGDQPTKVSGPDPELDCPTIDIRQGASTVQVNATAGADAGSLRYQMTFTRAARECAVAGGTMSIKVGVQGRIILGPAGAPGPVEVPLRLAVVREGVEPKTVWTKFYKVPAALAPGEGSTLFTYVEEGLSFPTPSRDELYSYVIYIGFDQHVAEPPGRKTKVKKKSR